MHDTLLQIQNAGLNVRKPLKVQFFGEEGVDEGGVQKVNPPLQSTISLSTAGGTWPAASTGWSRQMFLQHSTARS